MVRMNWLLLALSLTVATAHAVVVTKTPSTGGGGGSGDGAILDGSNSALKATVTAGHALKTDGSAVTQPVSGTFWQTTQPVSGTFWQTTQPISASSLPLPTGAAQEHTAANSPNSCRLSDGSSFLSTLPISAASLPLPSGAATSGNQTTANSSLSSIDSKLTSPLGVQGKDSENATITAKPVLVGGRASNGLASWILGVPDIEQVATNGDGNVVQALAVRDYSGGAYFSDIFSLDSGTPDHYVSGGNKNTTVLIDVTGTWTGSIAVKSAFTSQEVPTAVRNIETGAVTTAITANGIYASYGGMEESVKLSGTGLTGSADVFVQGLLYQTDVYSHIVGTVPLPTGAATSGKQDTGNTSLASIDTKIPASPATSGKQDTGNTSLASIDTKMPASPATSGKQDTGNTSVASIDTKTPALGQAAMAASTPVVIASNQSAVPVSGTVTASGPLTDTQLRASAVPVSGSGSFTVAQATAANLNATVAQSGTWTVQPGNTANSTAWLMKLDQTGSNNDVDVLTLPALTAGTNRIGSVRLVDSSDGDLTTTKGTQTTRAVMTHDLKDAGRTHVNYWATAAASGTTTSETAITLTKSSGTSVNSSAASFVVTSGKRFRITSITVGSRGNVTATAQLTTFNLRINTAGGVTTTSTPIVFSCSTATPATALAWDRCQIPIPDGFEIVGDGTLQFGLTAAATFTTNAPTWFATITGFEY